MSNDQRENVRFTLQPDQRRAKLKAGGKKFSAEIIDQSANGFRIQVSPETNVALNDVVTLEAWTGTCQAVVAFVEDVNKMRRLGLRRISDDVPTRMGWLRGLCHERRAAKPAKSKRGAGRRRFVAAGCFGLATLLAGGLAFCWHGDPAADRAAIRSLAKDDAEDESSSEATGADDVNAGDQKRQALAPSTSQPRVVPQPMLVLQHLLALHSTETVAALELSEQQKLEISRMLDEVSVGLSRIQSRRSTSTAVRQAKIRALFNRAEARAQQILTQQQRAKWQGDSAPQPPAAVQTTSVANSAVEK